jgi:hypothetical protein
MRCHPGCCIMNPPFVEGPDDGPDLPKAEHGYELLASHAVARGGGDG